MRQRFDVTRNLLKFYKILKTKQHLNQSLEKRGDCSIPCHSLTNNEYSYFTFTLYLGPMLKIGHPTGLLDGHPTGRHTPRRPLTIPPSRLLLSPPKTTHHPLPPSTPGAVPPWPPPRRPRRNAGEDSLPRRGHLHLSPLRSGRAP